MKNHLKRDKEDFLEKVYSLAFYAVMKTGLFMVMNSSRSKNE